MEKAVGGYINHGNRIKITVAWLREYGGKNVHGWDFFLKKENPTWTMSQLLKKG